MSISLDKYQNKVGTIEDLNRRLDIIEKVWDEYKHLDELLCDNIWMCSVAPSPIPKCTSDLWQAVRKAISGRHSEETEKPKEENTFLRDTIISIWLDAFKRDEAGLRTMLESSFK